MRKLFFAVLLAIACQSAIAQSQLHPARIFEDSMVLQRGKPIPVWGWAGKGEKLTIRFHNQVKSTVSGKDGGWRVTLDPEKEGGPYQLSIKGTETVLIKDVLVGDVWICSGQSNMEFIVASSNHKNEEIANAAFPAIRHIKITNDIAETPRADLRNTSGWHTAVPANVGSFTAVGYFFAREIYQKTKVPIGLINTTWGGTDVETWTSGDAFANSDEFKELMAGLPAINLDSMIILRKKTMLTKIEKLQGSMPSAAAIKQWKEFSFDDQNWQTMKLPGLWEQQSLPDFDGTVWFRKTITLTAAEASRGADLFLGMIDDADETYVNGVKVGATSGYNIKRIYIVPAGILQKGKNTIVVKVDDTGGGGGLYGDAAEMQLKCVGSDISLAGNWQYRVATIGGVSTLGPNSYPSLLYNAMVHPLIPFAFKGALWYQGENNAGRAYQYRKAFPLMITDWRKKWNQGNFPFYFVQLASFNAGGGNSVNGSTWAELREAQTMTLSLPNTGMAVTTDIGETKDIHPKNKQDVGKRLAAIAFNQLFGMKNIFSGPTYQSMRFAGNQAILSFSNTGSGLMEKSADHKLNGFELAGADGKFYPAVATLKGNDVTVSAPEVSLPVAVHYAWADDAGNANLFNKEGFPAVPFRTDEWKGVTEQGKYKITFK